MFAYLLGLNLTIIDLFYFGVVAEGPPLVIANGGSSGILPGQTDPAYFDAANSTKFPVAFLCDLQLTKDNMGVCRTGWNLSVSTNLTNILTNSSVPSTYVIQGVPRTGYFSVDFNLTQLNYTTGKASSSLLGLASHMPFCMK